MVSPFSPFFSAFFSSWEEEPPCFAGAVMGFIVPGNCEAYRERRAGERNALDTSGGGGGQESKGVSEFSLILRISLSPGPFPGNLYVGCWDPASEAQSYSGTQRADWVRSRVANDGGWGRGCSGWTRLVVLFR